MTPSESHRQFGEEFAKNLKQGVEKGIAQMDKMIKEGRATVIKSSMTDEGRKAMREVREWAGKEAEAIREKIKPLLDHFLAEVTQICDMLDNDVKHFSEDYWHRKDDIEAMHSIHNRLMEYKATGKWVEHTDRANNRYGCNICGSLVNIKSSFCPWCGAKMEGGGE